MKRTLFIVLAAAALCAACASDPTRQANCVRPTTRDAGMGILVPSCDEWIFGPTERQKEDWDKRHQLPAKQ